MAFRWLAFLCWLYPLGATSSGASIVEYTLFWDLIRLRSLPSQFGLSPGANLKKRLGSAMVPSEYPRCVPMVTARTTQYRLSLSTPDRSRSGPVPRSASL
jgi:hypothetical protein